MKRDSFRAYKELAISIVMQACIDYLKCKDDLQSKYIESFFKSKYCWILCGCSKIEPDVLLEQLKIIKKSGEKKSNKICGLIRVHSTKATEEF